MSTWLADHAAEEHVGHLRARWIVDGYPRVQLSCACGWKTGVEDNEGSADGDLAAHIAAQKRDTPTP